MHGRQVTRVSLHQSGGQLALQHQLLGTVGIGHDAFQQLHALKHSCFDLLPVGSAQHEWKEVQRPRPLWLVSGGINVVTDAVVTHLPLQVVHSGVQVGHAVGGWRVQWANELLPKTADLGVCQWVGRRLGRDERAPHFVPMAVGSPLLLKRQPASGVCFDGVFWCWRGPIHRVIVVDRQRLKSSVYGNSGLACSKALGCRADRCFMTPGVWPMRKNRAMRRLSAS